MLNFTELSFEAGKQVLSKRSLDGRKKWGQFLTPPSLARFTASHLSDIQSGYRILDPAMGSGILLCALVENIVAKHPVSELYIEGYEIDSELFQVASQLLAQVVDFAASKEIKIHLQLYPCDFVLEKLPEVHQPCKKYQHVIANPPYFKLNQSEKVALAARKQLKGHTNIYTLFMALALKLLSPDGTATFIVPRSFCSGTYFAAFRKELMNEVDPLSVHVFESRQDNFEAVLQENIVFHFRRKGVLPSPQHISISASQNLSDLTANPRQIQMQHFSVNRHNRVFFRLPVSEMDEKILEIVDKWEGTLQGYGLEVSTGPVVPFRTKSYLAEEFQPGKSVPLLWMHHIQPQQILLQARNGKQKPQGFLLLPESQQHITPARNYVLLRRFSAKEEARRLVAAPFLAKDYPYKWIGLENHLNFIYRKNGELQRSEARGLSALLNSGLMDRYFRMSNGNTQVNATEIRLLPLPPLAVIQVIGKNVAHIRKRDLDDIVTSALKRHHFLPDDFPILSKIG